MMRAAFLVSMVMVGVSGGLLKKVDPILTADLLHVLRSMGHGDQLCICDCNFPAAEVTRDHAQ